MRVQAASIVTLLQEARRITWPQYSETVRVSLLMMAITIVVALGLWLFDNVVQMGVEFIMGVRG